ncbi:hypothetical protein RB653_001232 [Dictyostelium firmibasis]|uniref:Uncharacterized protein n=1 Tax=Dictyostelium firmibasis TaxID=79012 RepID=A0AAN7U3P2_9MYCE
MNRAFNFSTKVATSINRCNSKSNNKISQSVSYNFINKPTTTSSTTSASTTQPSFTLPTSCNSNSSQSNLNSFKSKSQTIGKFSSNLLGSLLFEFQAYPIDANSIMTIFDSITLISRSSKSGLVSNDIKSKYNSSGMIFGDNKVSSVNCGACGDYGGDQSSWFNDNNQSSWLNGDGDCGCN